MPPGDPGVSAGRRRIGDGVRQPGALRRTARLRSWRRSWTARAAANWRAGASTIEKPASRLAPTLAANAAGAAGRRGASAVASVQPGPAADAAGVRAASARIVRRERIAVVVIGELVYGGWLVAPCRFLLRRKVVLYIHGEELTIDHRPFIIAQALRGAHLRLAHAIVTVSRFGQQALIDRYRIPPTQDRTDQQRHRSRSFPPATEQRGAARPLRADRQASPAHRRAALRAQGHGPSHRGHADRARATSGRALPDRRRGRVPGQPRASDRRTAAGRPRDASPAASRTTPCSTIMRSRMCS